MYELYTLDELKRVLRIRPSETFPDWIAREQARIDAVKVTVAILEAREQQEARQPRRVAR